MVEMVEEEEVSEIATLIEECPWNLARVGQALPTFRGGATQGALGG
jgi:hypothetical protein